MNIGTLLTKSANTFSDKIAIVHGQKQLTYGNFNSRVNKLANALLKLGICFGDKVAILQYNYPETLESLFACFKAGCVAVPINFRLHPKEFAYIIDHCDAKAVILSREFNESIREVKELIPNCQHFITLSGEDNELMDYEKLMAVQSDQWVDAKVKPDDSAWLFYTSGTTGKPKGAMLTHRNLLAMTMNFYGDMLALSSDDAILHAAPLSHGSGLFALPNIGKAAKNIILESKSFEPETVFKAIEEYKITNMFAAPTMVKMLIGSSAVDKYDHSSMKAIVYGGAPMYVDDLKKAIAKLGQCLIQLYGQGESPMTITYLPHRDHVLDGTDEQMKRLASSGIQRTDVEVKIFDQDDKELPCGETGEIVVASDIVMKGYYKNPEATTSAMQSGWLHTGDMGYMDKKGYLFLMDRSKDMLISGGENIYPREIEEVIQRLEAVKEVAVIGVPDPKWGDTVKAIVSLVPGKSVTEDEIIAFCKKNIASYKKPGSVDFVHELPKNNYGKILKRELRSKYLKNN